MKKIGPYIGVTGFMTLNEVVTCANAFHHAVHRNETETAKRMLLMIGLLVSSKTLGSNKNKWFNRYPEIGKVSEISSLEDDRLLYTIHYNTDDANTIDEQTDEIMKLSPATNAIQYNIKWASHVKLQRVKRKYPDLRIILQIGAGALAEVDEPGEIYLGEALRAYDGVADDFLVDPSGGLGKPVDVWRAFACIADDEIPKSMQPGVAGGLDANNIAGLKGLMRRLRRPVNADAEGRLRTDGEGGGHLVIQYAESFIQAGIAVISAY